MRTTAAALTAATLTLLAITGCSSDTTDPKPAATTAAASPTLDAEQQLQDCVEAIADTINDRPADFDPDTDTDPQPTECDDIDDKAYLDAYMDGLEQSNQQGRDALQDAIDDAAEQDQ